MSIADLRGKNVGAARSVDMRTGSAGTRGRLAIGTLLAAALIAGFVTQTESLFDDFWSSVPAVFGLLALLLAVALTVSLGEKVALPAAVASGVRMGCLSGMAFVLGVFSPFPLGVGGRELDEFGGDTAGPVVLFWFLIVLGGGGAAVGAICGTAAWVLRMSLGQRPSARKPDAREASG